MVMRRGTRRIRDARCLAAVVAGCAGLALLVGCTDDGDGTKIPPTATGTLEELAARAHCEPKLQTDAQELRQANCTTDDGRYVLATFATDRGQREWINEANDYGGAYLVGRRWVAVSDATVIAALRGRLGGTVETASPHHSGSGGSGGSETEHSGHRGS
ncbi:hypothetical protein [Streptomyces sp. RTGN2]|uniref:hypothetical protein n=1 Tax=Streptomyces sp. RTGN2 TaxID=3016525 RepID=UPI0025537386|nr:hypothetical protein [Streptomyces sp. RTGN2]